MLYALVIPFICIYSPRTPICFSFILRATKRNKHNDFIGHLPKIYRITIASRSFIFKSRRFAHNVNPDSGQTRKVITAVDFSSWTKDCDFHLINTNVLKQIKYRVNAVSRFLGSLSVYGK